MIDWAEHGTSKIFCAVAGEEPAAVRAVAADMSTEHPAPARRVLRDGRRRARRGAQRSGWGRYEGRSSPTKWSQTVPTCGSRPTTGSDLTGARRKTQSKGLVENLAGYVQRDLVVPSVDLWESVEDANAAVVWCEEVNGKQHSEIAAVPAERLVVERRVLRPLPSLRPPLRRGETRKVDGLATVRFDSARYSVPARLVGPRWTSPPRSSES
ncbi:MAG: hypothetical protein M3O70_21010 [Actinomycetota bacterium]|nr:hypothetical protein [Actinomycetota bacterium]